MSTKKYFIANAPINAPTIHIVNAAKVDYSKVKLYIATVVKNGKKVPSVAAGASWYVYFYYRNPATNKIDSKSKFDFKHGINRYKTVAQRKAFGQKLINAYTKMLEAGFNPWDKTVINNNEQEINNMTVRQSLNYALDQKRKEITQKTDEDWSYRLRAYLVFAEKQKHDILPITQIQPIHIIQFLNSLELSPKSINNFKSTLSALFTKLKDDLLITTNPAIGIKKRKENPQQNKPFTPAEITKIKEYLIVNDPGLLFYIRFVAFAFLRPVEVCRLTVGDIDLKGSKLRVQTKTERAATVRILPKLKKQLQLLKLQQYNATDFLITRNNTPGPWINTRTNKDAAEKTRAKVMSDRFRKVKKHFGFGNEYGIYSIRHTFALDLYNSFINSDCTTIEAELKMLPITRHKSITGLRNYLRGIGALMPKDYSGNITIDL